jgi:hypothetical protein
VESFRIVEEELGFEIAEVAFPELSKVANDVEWYQQTQRLQAQAMMGEVAVSRIERTCTGSLEILLLFEIEVLFVFLPQLLSSPRFFSERKLIIIKQLTFEALTHSRIKKIVSILLFTKNCNLLL